MEGDLIGTLSNCRMCVQSLNELVAKLRIYGFMDLRIYGFMDYGYEMDRMLYRPQRCLYLNNISFDLVVYRSCPADRRRCQSTVSCTTTLTPETYIYNDRIHTII